MNEKDPKSTTSLDDLLKQNKLNDILLHEHELQKRETKVKTGHYEYSLGDLGNKFF